MNIKTQIQCAALLAPLLGGCRTTKTATEPASVTFGFNALEVGVSEDSGRIRAINNMEVDLGEVGLTYHGLNDFDRGAEPWHFGANVFGVRPESWPFEVVAKTVTTEDGFAYESVGIRSEKVSEWLNGFGYVEVTTNQDAVDLRVFYGRGLSTIWDALPKDLSISVFHSGWYFHEGEKSDYLELQLEKAVGKVSYFGRIEAADYDLEQARLLLGISLSF